MKDNLKHDHITYDMLGIFNTISCNLTSSGGFTDRSAIEGYALSLVCTLWESCMDEEHCIKNLRDLCHCNSI